MISEDKIKRINELAKLDKEVGLSREEKNEQLVLRQEYIQAVRTSLKANLDCIEIVDEEDICH